MKKLARKNQIIVAGLALMIAAAGYLNYSGKLFPEKTDTEVSSDLANKELLDLSDEDAALETAEIVSQDEEPEGTPGEAVLTSGIVAEAKIAREQVRAQNKETLSAIIDNANISEAEKQEAIGQLVKMTGIAEKEVAAETLPTGFGYEFSGMTREEQSASGSTTALIFVLCLVFVYLLLSAQYESYILPLVVILSVPFGLMGSFIFAQFMGVENNIYMQIALIMLIGLLAKNAILITEFALERRQSGMSIVSAAVLGASARLRPILMTSLAMVIGLLPMMFASGVGANGNSTLGSGAIGGMLIGMICQIFTVPAMFVAFQYLQEKIKPIEWHDTDNTELESEIEQYTK